MTAMLPMKRLEIILDAPEERPVTALLDRAGVSGYTIIRNVAGKGGRGIQRGDELTDVFSNVLIMTACTPEQADRAVELLRPLMTRVGGLVLVSDAHMLVH
jgi:nitrogen regulatory protein PII